MPQLQSLIATRANLKRFKLHNYGVNSIHLLFFQPQTRNCDSCFFITSLFVLVIGTNETLGGREGY